MSPDQVSIAEVVLEKLRKLPETTQYEVLDFVEFLEHRGLRRSRQPLRSVEGIAADLGVSISAKEIDEARQEMWASFPRELPQENDE
jgi:hypothetical protein